MTKAAAKAVLDSLPHGPAPEAPAPVAEVKAPEVAPEPEVEAAPAPKVRRRTSLKTVVYHSVSQVAFCGEFLTQVVLEDQTITLRHDVPVELPADVADALIALSNDLFVVEQVL